MVPKYFWLGLKSINVGDFEKLKKRNLQAIYLKGDIYLSNHVSKKEDIIDFFEFARRKYGIKQFFIDSMMLIEMDARQELTEQKNVVKALKDFTIEYDCHIHLVSHPRKTQSDMTRPDKVDVSGSGILQT